MRTLITATLALFILTACDQKPKEQVQTEEKTAPASLESSPIVKVEQASAPKTPISPEITVSQEVQAPVHELPSGASLYTQKCASCHGSDAKKSALNSSKPIAGWSTQRLKDALSGYQDGSYGGKMKGIMQAQSKPLSDTEISRLSEYISVL